MLARKLISRNACRRPVPKTLTFFSVGLPRTVCSFGNDFIVLEMKESLLTFHDDNFCEFHVLYACKGDTCALKTRGRFVTERGKKPKFKPRPHCLGN